MVPAAGMDYWQAYCWGKLYIRAAPHYPFSMPERTLALLDIFGPVMIGPSSSHTAGVVRIAFLARALFPHRLRKVRGIREVVAIPSITRRAEAER